LIVSTPARAQTEAGFGERPKFALRVPAFSDREVTSALATLDRLLAAEKDRAKWGAHANGVLWNFARHLQTGRMTSTQEALVVKHLDALAAARPQEADIVGRARFMVTALTVGKTAPDIVGKDLDGMDLRLSDYRGKVVVLTFSAEWCGICRTLYPYQRFMLDVYKNWPFAMLSVETGSSVAIARQAKADAGLPYRSWWDARVQDTPGQIATAWNVGGFPTLYVIDGAGVIRFVDLRYEDLLKGVRQLLSEDPPPVQARTPAPRAQTSSARSLEPRTQN
jgi:peroxiredoxin